MTCAFARHLVVTVAMVLSLVFRSTDSLSLPEHKRCFTPLTFLGHSNGIGTRKKDDEICNVHCVQDSSKFFQPFIGRRESIASMVVLVVSSQFAAPEMAHASSPETKPPTKNSNSKPEDRPIDFELSVAVQKLLDLDEPNRLVEGKDYDLNVQGRRNTQQSKLPGQDLSDDVAPDPLFSRFDPQVFANRPTYKTFVALLDNYQPNVCLPEDNTPDETQEDYAFLEACMATPVMKFCYAYCKSKLNNERENDTEQSVATSGTKYSFDTEEEFVQLLYKIWFRTYSRSKGCGKNTERIDADNGSASGNQSSKKVYGSSGFEHVFVGEIRNGKVIGFHNWIQLYRQEQAGNLDYRGTMGEKKSQDMVLTYNLRWMGSEKPIGSSLIGVSPEFELALYTMVFLVGNPKDNLVLVNLGSGERKTATKLDIKCFRTKGRVGSCYVEALS